MLQSRCTAGTAGMDGAAAAGLGKQQSCQSAANGLCTETQQGWDECSLSSPPAATKTNRTQQQSLAQTIMGQTMGLGRDVMHIVQSYNGDYN